jgi:hypothetical protein
LAALALLLPGCGWAISSQAGTSGAQFLKLGAGARAGGMAEAHLAFSDDVHAVYYNPAGLTRSVKPMAAGMHNDRFQDIDYEFLAFSYPWGLEEGHARHAVGLSLYNLSIQGLERRVGDTDIPTGTFAASDNAYGLSYAYRPSRELGFGATAKFVRSKIDVVGTNAVAFDLGVQRRVHWGRAIDLAAVVRNVGSKQDFGQGSDPLPRMWGLGASGEVIPGLRAAVDVLKARDTSVFVSMGAEYRRRFDEKLSGALRGGWSSHIKDIEGLNGVAAGFGLGLGPVDFDFAWVPFGDLGQTFRYSLAVRF